MLDDRWAHAFVARVAKVSRGDAEGNKPIDTRETLDILIRDARVALGQSVCQPICSVTGQRNCAERDCELHADLAPLKLDADCSQCSPRHDRGDGHCERHGKRVGAAVGCGGRHFSDHGAIMPCKERQ